MIFPKSVSLALIITMIIHRSGAVSPRCLIPTSLFRLTMRSDGNGQYRGSTENFISALIHHARVEQGSNHSSQLSPFELHRREGPDLCIPILALATAACHLWCGRLFPRWATDNESVRLLHLHSYLYATMALIGDGSQLARTPDVTDDRVYRRRGVFPITVLTPHHRRALSRAEVAPLLLLVALSA